MYSGVVKGTSWAEETLNGENVKPIALAIVEFHGIRQLVSKLVSQSVSQLKIQLNNFFLISYCSNVLKAFLVDLKAYLGLVLPNQYCPIVI